MTYVANGRYTVYGTGIVRDTLKNLFVRMIDERNVWFILVIKIIYFSVSTVNCCFFALFSFHKIIILTIMIERLYTRNSIT